MTQNTALLLEEALNHLRTKDVQGNHKGRNRPAAYRILVPLALGDSPETGQAAFRLAQICNYLLTEETRLTRSISADEPEKLERALGNFRITKSEIESIHGEPITSKTYLNWAKIGHNNNSPACSRICGDYYRYDAFSDCEEQRASNNAKAYRYYLDAAKGGDTKGTFRALKMQAYMLDGVTHDPTTMLSLARHLHQTATRVQEEAVITDIIEEYIKRNHMPLIRRAFAHAVLVSGIYDTGKISKEAPTAEPLLTLEDIGPYPGGSISDAEPAP